MIKLLLFFVFILSAFADVKKEVRFALWSGNSNINNWIDNFVAKDVKKKFGI